VKFWGKLTMVGITLSPHACGNICVTATEVGKLQKTGTCTPSEQSDTLYVKKSKFLLIADPG
jgi:hypothetical protein